MPEVQEQFKQHVDVILEAAMFENWLRFYFIHAEEKDGREELTLQLPQKSMERIRERYSALYPLAERLNGKAVDFAISRNAVLEYIMNYIDGKEMERGEAQRILESRAFQTRLQLFHIWAQTHEEALDRGFAEFGDWRKFFAQWLETPAARELAQQLAAAPRQPGQE